MKVKLHTCKRQLDEVMANLDGSWWMRNDGDTVIIVSGRIYNVREQRALHGDVTPSIVTISPDEGVEYTMEAFHNQSMNRPLGRVLIFQS